MTTYQDPPPQSRRSARESERAEPDPIPQNSTADYATHTPITPAAQPPAGRRASRIAEQGLYEVSPEPLTYVTQGYPTGAVPTPIGSSPVATGPAPAEAQYRVRDFSPEGGRGRRSAPPLVEPGRPSELDYQTQQVPPPSGSYVQPGVVPVAPVVSQASVPQQIVQQAADPTLSRRELREQAAGEQAAALGGVAQPYGANPTAQPGYPTAQPGYSTAQPSYPTAQPGYPTQQPGLSTQPPASAQFTGQQPIAPPSSGGRRAAPSAPPPPTNLTSAMAEFDTLTRAGAIPPGGGARVAAPLGYPPAPGQNPTGQNPTGQNPTGQNPTGQQPAPQQPMRARQPVPMAPEVEETGGWIAPAGHWSRQADLDDETQPWSGTITRDVGIGHVSTTTSTLIVPNAPNLSDFPAALTSTGEVLLTGSIDLPRSLSATGSDSRRYDDPTVDHMFDSNDGEFTATNSTPVRAVKAVSTHTSARGVIGATAPRGNRMLTVLFVSAFVLAVVVAGLFIYVANNGV